MNLRIILVVGVYVIYLVIGASILSAIEGPKEHDKRKMLRQLRQNFKKSVEGCVTGTLLF